MPEYQINHFAKMQLLGAIANIVKYDHDPDKAFAAYDEKVLAEEYLIPKNLLTYDKYTEFLRERTALIKKRVGDYLADSQIPEVQTGL